MWRPNLPTCHAETRNSGRAEKPGSSLPRKAVADPPRPFVGKTALYIFLGVGARDHVNRLHFLLQWLQDVIEESLAIGEDPRNPFLAGGAAGPAICCFVVPPK